MRRFYRPPAANYAGVADGSATTTATATRCGDRECQRVMLHTPLPLRRSPALRGHMRTRTHSALARAAQVSAYRTIVGERERARASGCRQQVLFVFYLAEEFESTSTACRGVERERVSGREREGVSSRGSICYQERRRFNCCTNLTGSVQFTIA